MKLLSDFRDYYDAMLATDRDPDPVFRRFTKKVKWNRWDDSHRRPPEATTWGLGHPRVHGPPAVQVSFCGTVYHGIGVPYYRPNEAPRAVPLFRFHFTRPDFVRGVQHLHEHFCNPDVAPHYSKGKGADLVQQVTDENPPTISHKERASLYDLAVNTWRIHGNLAQPPTLRYTLQLDMMGWQRENRQQHIGLGVPIIVNTQTGGGLTASVNAPLVDHNFSSVMPAHNAWQELSMFLGNDLVTAGGSTPRPISDELRAETHGFDRKASFRKVKGKEKLNRETW